MPIPRHTAAVPVIALALVLLTACTPGPTPTTSTSASPSGSSTPSASPTPTSSATATPVPDPIPVDMRANIVDAMNSGNTAAIEGYLAPTVHLTYAASENEGDVSDHVLIINNLTDFVAGFPTWDFNLPASVVDDYANNPGTYPSYVDDFPAGALVGRSSNGKVISFAISGGQITRIFFAFEDSLTF